MEIKKSPEYRDVIEKIVERFSKQGFRALVADRQLQHAMGACGRDKLKEAVQSYFEGGKY